MPRRYMHTLPGSAHRPALARAVAVLVGALVALACVVAPPRMARAAEGDATLTLQMRHTASGKTVQVPGITATIYRVADLDANINHYTLRSEFSALGVNFDEGLTAAQMEKAAADALKIATSKKVSGTSRTSDSGGNAAFGVLPYGVYLVAHTGATGDGAAYEPFEPFLVSVPQLTGDDIVYDVVCLPKLTPVPAKPTPVEPEKQIEKETKKVTEKVTEKTTPVTNTVTRQGLSKTGDETSWHGLWACVAAGLAFVELGMLFGRRGTRNVAGR